MVDLHAETLSERDLSALVDDVVGPPSDVGFFLLVDYLGYPVSGSRAAASLPTRRRRSSSWTSERGIDALFFLDRKRGYLCERWEIWDRAKHTRLLGHVSLGTVHVSTNPQCEGCF